LKYLIDTNIISEIISKQPNQNVLDFFNTLDSKNLYLSVITIGELKYGIDRLPDSKRKTQLNKWFETLLIKYQPNIIDIDIETMIIWSNINKQTKEKGITLTIMDSLIASSALNHNLILVTRNIKDFYHIKNITLLNPFEGL
jgi:tRNA(fMet)-specific endonuclease VapC